VKLTKEGAVSEIETLVQVCAALVDALKYHTWHNDTVSENKRKYAEDLLLELAEKLAIQSKLRCEQPKELHYDY
jgi:hypothetical protein